MALEGGVADAAEFHVEEAEVEGGVVGDQGVVCDEVAEGVGDIGEAGFSDEVRAGEAVDARGFGGDVAVGVDEGVVDAAGGEVALELEAGDLDEAVAVQGVEACRFRVEEDGPGCEWGGDGRRLRMRRWRVRLA